MEGVTHAGSALAAIQKVGGPVTSSSGLSGREARRLANPCREEGKTGKAGRKWHNGGAGLTMSTSATSAAGAQTVADNVIIVSARQRKNTALINLIKKFKVQFVEDQQVADFVFGAGSIGLLFLSITYHLIQRDYLNARVQLCKKLYKVRVVLLLADPSSRDATSIFQVTALASANDFTVILCWSLEECASYIETFKQNEFASATTIQARFQSEYLPRLQDVLTQVPSVNKTDVKSLASTFGSLKSIMAQSEESFSLCPGVGAKKAKELHDCFNAPFLGS